MRSLPTLPRYKEEFVRLLYAIIVVEFVVITVLLFGFSNEYLSNAYLQDWIGAHLPLLGILLHGEVDALFIGVALGATVLLIQRKVKTSKSQEDTRRGVKPPAPGYKSTSLNQNRTIQGEAIPDQASPSKANILEERPVDVSNELEKTDS